MLNAVDDCRERHLAAVEVVCLALGVARLSKELAPVTAAGGLAGGGAFVRGRADNRTVGSVTADCSQCLSLCCSSGQRFLTFLKRERGICQMGFRALPEQVIVYYLWNCLTSTALALPKLARWDARPSDVTRGIFRTANGPNIRVLF